MSWVRDLLRSNRIDQSRRREAEDALRAAELELARAASVAGEAEHVTERLAQHRRENHFAEMLTAAFELRRRDA